MYICINVCRRRVNEDYEYAHIFLAENILNMSYPFLEQSIDGILELFLGLGLLAAAATVSACRIVVNAVVVVGRYLQMGVRQRVGD